MDTADATGAIVISVYAKVENAYAIYRTTDRVLVQFSDDPTLGADQRKLLAPLGPLRGEINGLIDGWRKREPQPRGKGLLGLVPDFEHDMRAKAAFFDRRVADALTLALQGGALEAGILLAAVKADVLEERNSIARTQYLYVAGAVFLGLIGAIALGTYFTNPDPEIKIGTVSKIGPNASGFAAALGALGALFSIALALRSRELLTDLQTVDNIMDASTRIAIGAISAFMLYCLISAGYFSFSFGPPVSGADSASNQLRVWQPGLAVIAFVAGFSERLVGDALGRATLGAPPTATSMAGGTAFRAASGPSHLVNERNPLGRASAATTDTTAAQAAGAGLAALNDDEESSEGGHEHEGDEGDRSLTADVELPEAVGGVERTT